MVIKLILCKTPFALSVSSEVKKLISDATKKYK